MNSSSSQPPRFFLKLLKWFCDPNLYDYLVGDLLEHFELNIKSSNPVQAKATFAKDVVLLFRPGIIKPFLPHFNFKTTLMIRHNLRISTRGLLKDPVSFFVSSTSMTVGLVSIMFIFLWVNDEMSMNKFHTKSDRLYQIFLNDPSPIGIETSPNTQVLLAESLKESLPQVEHATTVVPYEWFDGEKFIISNGEDKIFTSKNQFASKDYFEVFSFPIIHGRKDQLLKKPNAVVISEHLAIKLFDKANPVGQTVEWLHPYYGGTYEVSGVFASVSNQSTQQFDAVFPMEIMIEDEGEEWLRWTESDPYTYFTLKEQNDIQLVEEKIISLVKEKNESLNSYLTTQLYADTYLYDSYNDGSLSGGRIQFVRLFLLIGLVILFVASFNFMVLTTARANTKIKQIGIKKSMGASKGSLSMQYFMESFLITLISSALAIICTLLLLPQFNIITGKALVLNGTMNELIYLLTFIIFTALINGIYPALILSRLNPIIALRGKGQKSTRQWTRKSLITLQFSMSSILIVIAFVISAQIEFIQSKDLGFEKEDMIWFTMGKPKSETDGELSASRIKSFLSELNTIPGVERATNFAHNVLGAYGTTTGLSWPKQEAPLLIAQVSGGYELIETLGIKVLSGRSFSQSFATDTEKLILNEAAVKEMQLENPIGKVVQLWDKEREIIGIVKDFHIDQLYHDILPTFIKLDLDDFAPHILVKLSTANQATTLRQIENEFSEFFIDGYPFEFKYLSDDYEEFYADEFRVGKLAKFATGIAIILSCLGLFAFAGFNIQKRMTELAIRKAIGSGAFRLIKLLLLQFLTLVGISILIATPVSLIISKNWLNNFAFHVDLTFLFFFKSSALIILLTCLAIAFHTMRGANVNVIHYLNRES